MTLLTVTTSRDRIPTLAGELEDIVCRDLDFAQSESGLTFTAELGSMSSSVRNDVRVCLARRGVTVFVFEDEKA